MYLLKSPCGQLEMIKQGFLNMSAIWSKSALLQCRFVTHNIHLHYTEVVCPGTPYEKKYTYIYL